jgi:lipoyl(octanoyl) transferase
LVSVKYKDLGLIDYKEAWDFQQEIFDAMAAQKLLNRSLPESEQVFIQSQLFFCEHPHVYTLGKSGDEDHLLLDEEGLSEKEVTFYKINRGGDITYHGPGQIVGYPLFDLEQVFTDIGKYLRFLEEAMIRMLAEYGIVAGRIEGETGVWLDERDPLKARKICAMGVKISRWITMHGFALNVNSDLSYFTNIIPCGIQDKGVTSMEKELGRKMDMDEVKEKIRHHMQELFYIEWV